MARAKLSQPAFHRGKPFYPIAMSYSMQLLSLREYAVQGMIGRLAYRKAVAPLLRPVIEDRATADASLDDAVAAYLGPLALGSNASGEKVILDPAIISKDAATRYSRLARALIPAAGAVLVLAYELCKSEPFNDRGPLLEFLRHCRNAVAHKGRFHFVKGEPCRPAVWRSIMITPSLAGTRVIDAPGTSGLLGPADPLLLLWDIENAYDGIPMDSDRW